MSEKKLKIKLLPNGEIQMETQGVKGKKCLDYIGIMKIKTTLYIHIVFFMI